MSSNKPNEDSHHMDGCEKVSFGLVIACGDRSELFDTTEEILNKVAAIVKLLVIGYEPSDGLAWAV
jgi:hypothetical protein